MIRNNEQDADPATGGEAARILTCDDLMARFATTLDGKRLTVGMIGYPNVGKSSIINALLGEKKVSVACTPGKTRHFQTHKLNETVTLCDCPGLVFPTFMLSKAELVLNGVIPIDKLRDFVTPFALLTTRITLRQIKLLYPIKLESDEPTPGEVLDAFAIFRGMLLRSKTPDRTGASRELLKQFVKCRLLFCKPPPSLAEEARGAFLAETERVATIRNSSTGQKRPPPASPERLAPVAESHAEPPVLKPEILSHTLDVNTNWDQKWGNSNKKHARRARKQQRKGKHLELRAKVQKKVLEQFAATA